MSINKDSQKAPNLRFKDFTDDWEQRKLGEYTKYRRGSFPQPYGNKEWYGGENAMPFVQVVDVSNNLKLKPKTKQNISSIAQSKSVFVSSGTVVVTLQGSIGRVAITQYDSYVDRTLLIFEDYERKTDKYFWGYTIQNKFNIEKEKAPGGTIKTITKAALSQFVVSIPPYDEQSKIGTFLKNIDKTITLHQRKLDQLNQLKEALLQQMFPGKGETVPKLRFAGFEGDWNLEPFSELWKQTNEKNKNFEFLPTEVISVSRMKLNPSNRNPKDEYMTTYNVFRKGDIAFEGNKSKKHDFGRFVLNDIQDGIVSHVFVVYRPQANFNSDFMKVYINSEQVMREHLKHSTTKTLMMTTLNNHEIKKRKLKMPTLSEQNKIGDTLKHLDDIITLQQRKLDQLKNMKQVLLENMFI